MMQREYLRSQHSTQYCGWISELEIDFQFQRDANVCLGVMRLYIVG